MRLWKAVFWAGNAAGSSLRRAARGKRAKRGSRQGRAGPWRGRFEQLESRALLNAGGGFTNGGIQGEYYASAAALPGTPVSAPYGSPAFTRSDIRVDFNWGTTGQPGGSPSPALAGVSVNNFSVLWNGEVIPKFSQTYTFTVTTVGGDLLYIRPHGSSTWTTLVNDWTIHAATADTATYAFTAGQTYDIELQYRQPTAGAAAECKLHWSSPSTPDEAIEPAAQVGVNIDGGDALLANMVNGGLQNYWWAPGNGSQAVATDSNVWPTADARDLAGRRRFDDRRGRIVLDPVQRHGERDRPGSGPVLGRRHKLRQHFDGRRWATPAAPTPPPPPWSFPANVFFNGFDITFTNTSRDGHAAAPSTTASPTSTSCSPRPWAAASIRPRERSSPPRAWPWLRSSPPCG